jgi:predicted Zn-dependent protease
VAQKRGWLATVMGHEMAHATARHGSERMLKQRATQTLLTVRTVSLGEMDWQQRQAVMAALGAGAQYGLILPLQSRS